MTDSREVHPVYVDGPLLGQDYPLYEHQLEHGLMYLEPIGPSDWMSLNPTQPVPAKTYRFHRIAMFGRIVLVGAVEWPAPPLSLFTALASGAAKNAVLPVDKPSPLS